LVRTGHLAITRIGYEENFKRLCDMQAGL
jgi:hypothetical protein